MARLSLAQLEHSTLSSSFYGASLALKKRSTRSNLVAANLVAFSTHITHQLITRIHSVSIR